MPALAFYSKLQNIHYFIKITMTTPASALAEQAEALLHGKFARLREPTKYIASFRTESGRHLALTRQVKNDIYIWAEGFNESLNGISIKNRDFPGLPYLPEQPRSSNLTTASSRLGLGNLSYYIKCDTLVALERFATWYQGT
jgi:hypothetical protein